MTELMNSKWKICEDAVANSVGDETVILHLGNGNYYGLDEVGSQLWEGLKAGQTPAAIASELARKYEVQEQQIHADIEKFLKDLIENDLVTGD